MYPERACDWIEQHGVRGRAFNTFSFGGYLLYRFYPDPGRLPFMDIHQAGTKEIRYLYAYALQDTTAWRVTEQRFRFDWVLLPGATPGSPLLANFIDADTTWALVFADDEAVLWLRRDGSCASLARQYAYHYMPGGPAGIGPLGARAARDSTIRGPIRAEFDRAIADSPYNARAQSFAGNLALLEGAFDDACRHFDAAAKQQPLESNVLDRQGLSHLYAGDLAGAERAFRAARRAARRLALGRPARGPAPGRARPAGRGAPRVRALARAPPRRSAEARDSLERMREFTMTSRRLLAGACMALAGALETAWLSVRWLGEGQCRALGSARLDCAALFLASGTTPLGLPLVVWGNFGYTAATLLAVAAVWLEGPWALRARAAFHVLAIGMALFSLFLVARMVALHAFCPWCLLSAVLSRRWAPLPRPGSRALAAPRQAAAGAGLASRAGGADAHDRRPPGCRRPAGDPLVLDAIARHLSASGARFYGVWWCEGCRRQKELFGRRGRRPALRGVQRRGAAELLSAAVPRVARGSGPGTTWEIAGRQHHRRAVA